MECDGARTTKGVGGNGTGGFELYDRRARDSGDDNADDEGGFLVTAATTTVRTGNRGDGGTRTAAEAEGTVRPVVRGGGRMQMNIRLMEAEQLWYNEGGKVPD